MNSRSNNLSRKSLWHDWPLLLPLAGAAISIQGYHPFTEDAEIYVPQIRKILDPSLYPFGAEFFETHARLTLFPNLVAESARISHLPVEWALLACHFLAILLLVVACRRIASKCFPSETARWAGLAMVACLLALPVAGTALYIMDQYFNPRSIFSFSILFAIDAVLDRKYWRGVLWLGLSGLVHPLMTVWGLFYVCLLAMAQATTQGRTRATALLAASTVLVIPGVPTREPSQAYLQSFHDHRYYFLFRWQWFEWLGILGPLVLLWWFGRIAARKERPVLRTVSISLLCFGAACLLGTLVASIPALQFLLIYQPLRSFQLIYLLMALLGGGLVGEWLHEKQALGWLALFVPLAVVMGYSQFELYPSDRHIEWPAARSTNSWVEAFEWVRESTPKDSIFALEPDYMSRPGEDFQGFRAIAARSRLADATKDWSAVVMFPNLLLADECLSQMQSANALGAADPTRLKELRRSYGVNWIVVRRPSIAALDCSYQNQQVAVCRLN